MSGTAAVLVCVLDLLGRQARSLPPIELLAAPPRVISPNAEAFVQRDPDRIYLITSAPSFRRALDARLPCSNTMAIRKLASILVHEQWHLQHGADERTAYEAQLTALLSFGVPPESIIYHEVVKSMLAVSKADRMKMARSPAAVATPPVIAKAPGVEGRP